ncbi:hypothetical protein P280DRAFT_468613 [Massarina eburnea CBS 473.64]|uniref:GAT domain-containing protein n=1 Tax=Massarina eburnea CBS 473.64 TaxID=1395130 RepID=A0A6A6S4T8_9PLEO|nr:hypothetical protein P280DRAFT_468613 [Massarina eburnea CBS 473.64]
MVLKKRFTNLGSLIKRTNSSDDAGAERGADTPEGNVQRGIKLFCESGAANAGEEVLHLPTIVESAVASPSASAVGASQIRKLLSKENYDRPHVQYNAVMLIRILADNPGPSFTKNMDKNFADTVKQLLRNGRDPSVAQILRETLDAMEKDKAYDTNLNAIFAMWKKEKQLMANAAKSFGPRTMSAPQWNGGQHQQPHRQSAPTGLPPPVELASRIEEARTSAKLLLQLVQSTPSNELLGNDLIKEFSERCIAAQRSIQGYINCDSPAPDDDTMLTLIETNEQLSLAASKHQRAVLQARRLLGPSPSPPVPNLNHPLPPAPGVSATYTPPTQNSPFLPPADVGGRQEQNSASTTRSSDLALPPSLQAGQKAGGARTDDPFADHHATPFAAPQRPPPGRPVEEDGSPVNGYTGSPYNPGYQSTPSYLNRQESASNNLTMHGAQHPSTEEEEYARDYPANSGRRTPEQPRTRPRADSEVSPIAERAPVTYRY